MTFTKLGILVHQASAATWDGASGAGLRLGLLRAPSRTGGPEDDDEAELVGKLLPLVALLSVLDIIFGG